MSKQEFKVPDWAITDEEIDDAIPGSGWVRDYLEYARTSTDAPLAYHAGTALTVLSQACSHLDIRCYSQEGERGHHEVTTPLWTSVIGFSGDRKSYSMNIGMRILKRAVGHDVILPDDGSVEALVDYISENPNVILHRDELSFLFAQSGRSHMRTFKPLLLTLHSGETFSRTTRQDRARKSDSEEEGESKPKRQRKNEMTEVERPRITMLGGIPPEVFRSQGDSLDWSSGFLARFFFLPAVRTRMREAPIKRETHEMELAKWLKAVPSKFQGYIKLPVDTSKIISSWFLEEVEALRGKLDDKVYSHLTRYQDLAVRITAMFAMSYVKPKEAREVVVATPKHAKAACALLSCVKDAILYLIAELVKPSARQFEDEMLEFFEDHQSKWFTLDELDLHFPQYSRRTIAAICKEWREEGRLLKDFVRTKRKVQGARRLKYKFSCIQPTKKVS